MPRRCLIAMGKGVEIVSQPTFDDTSFFPTTVNNPAGLIQLAVGPTNLDKVNRHITPERFPLGKDVREVRLKVLPFLDKETAEECARRLEAEGWTLENTGELATFMMQHPKEVERWNWVFALGVSSRWTDLGGRVNVPCVRVRGENRYFYLTYFHHRSRLNRSSLVSRK